MVFKEMPPDENSPEMLAIGLVNYIRDFVPKGWQECIGKVMPVPSFCAEDIKILIKEYHAGSLMDYLNAKYQRWYVIEAIAEYFKIKINHND